MVLGIVLANRCPSRASRRSRVGTIGSRLSLLVDLNLGLGWSEASRFRSRFSFFGVFLSNGGVYAYERRVGAA